MSIRLETSKRSGIRNYQRGELQWGQVKYLQDLAKQRPHVQMRTKPSTIFNCHGLTFASRRTKVTDSSDILKILKDDEWQEIPAKDVIPGDIIIYFDNDNDINHSGIVVGLDQLKVPLICSKWGVGCEYIHKVPDVPNNLYGPLTKYYRCIL